MPHQATLKVNDILESVISSKSLDLVDTCYRDSSQFLVPNMPPVVGLEDIRGAFDYMIGLGFAKIKLVRTEFEAFGDSAWEAGTYHLSAADGSPVDHGKFIVIWKKDAKGWFLFRDIFNSDVAAPE